MPNTPEYFRKWYEKNKETLSAKRKEKYQTDLEYRDKILTYRKLHQAEASKRRREKLVPK